MFSGMPAYQISTRSNNLIQYVAKVITLGFPRFSESVIFIFSGFLYITFIFKDRLSLICCRCSCFLIFILFIINIKAGHMTKALAIGYMPMVVAAVLYTYRGKML